MLSVVWKMPRLQAARNIGPIMRCAIDLESRLLKTAELYAPGRKGSDAVTWILDDYPRLVAEIRDLRKRLSQLDQEGAELDHLLAELQHIARRILEV